MTFLAFFFLQTRGPRAHGPHRSPRVRSARAGGLLGRVGPTRAMTVTFLIPVFGMLWGWLFLDEEVTWSMLAGTAVILLGTLLSNGLLSPRLFIKERTA